MVQGSHAVAEFVYENPNIWHNGYLIFCEAKTEQDLKEFILKVKEKNGIRIPSRRLPLSFFNEPDLDGAFTAVAIYCNGSEVKKFKKVEYQEK